MNKQKPSEINRFQRALVRVARLERAASTSQRQVPKKLLNFAILCHFMLLIEFKSAYFQNAVFISSASQNRVTSGQRGTPVSWSKPTGVPLCSIRIIPQAMYNLNIFQNPCELLVPSCHFLVEASFALCIRARSIEPLCSLFDFFVLRRLQFPHCRNLL